ncbi:MAG TPA: ABC transporter ATP-binding protein, partial [Actinomycetota bacterium]
YLYRKEREGAERPASRPPAAKPRAPQAKERRRAAARERERLREGREAVRRVEAELERATAELRAIEERLADPGFYAPGGEEVGEAVRRHGELRERIAELEAAWEEAVSALEASG